MPNYSFTCPSCGYWVYLARNIANRDDPATCPQCQTSLERRPDATQGLFASSGSVRPSESRLPTGTVNLVDCGAIGNGGDAIRASGGHLNVRNFTAIDNGGSAFHLSDGATVDADGVIHIARDNRKASSPKPAGTRSGSKDGIDLRSP